jgi:hypothetical protein
VKAVATNPFRLNLRILGKWQHEAKLPLPIDNAPGQTKVARKSLGIEHTVPVAELEALHSRPDSVFQLHRELGSWPCLEHLHYVNAHALCELRIHEHGANAEWLTIILAQWPPRSYRKRTTTQSWLVPVFLDASGSEKPCH